jgi:hypothetical protein
VGISGDVAVRMTNLDKIAIAIELVAGIVHDAVLKPPE